MVISQNRSQDTEVLVLHVVASTSFYVTAEIMAGYPPALNEFRIEQLESGRKLTARAAERLRAAGFQVDTLVEEGDPKSKIIDMAAQWSADLIVLGSHGRKGLDRFLLGSVSELVARHASCSVEIVRMPANR